MKRLSWVKVAWVVLVTSPGYRGGRLDSGLLISDCSLGDPEFGCLTDPDRDTAHISHPASTYNIACLFIYLFVCLFVYLPSNFSLAEDISDGS